MNYKLFFVSDQGESNITDDTEGWLWPEVSNPLGSVVSEWTKNTQNPIFLKTEKIIQNAKTQKRLEICQN